jgi:hypothetical protein
MLELVFEVGASRSMARKSWVVVAVAFMRKGLCRSEK